jgi:NAD(P)-dependent dehydrogenase (short-subunit alcohol dehydrogenase family)
VTAALRAGDRVVATGRSLDKLRAAFPENASEAMALVELDVTDEAQAAAAIKAAIARFGRIDVVVNNAGYCVLGNFEDLGAAEVRRQLETNFFGVVHVLNAALPVLRKQRSGHIFNISSVASAIGMNHCSAYSASKFTVEGLCMAIAAEVERFGIWSTVVEPGFFRTSFLNQQNAMVVETAIKDYAAQGSARDAYAAYDGTQLGDPLKLGEALLSIVAMEHPPRLFAAGSDAVDLLRPAAEARLRALEDNLALSRSTDGDR